MHSIEHLWCTCGRSRRPCSTSNSVTTASLSYSPAVVVDASLDRKGKRRSVCKDCLGERRRCRVSLRPRRKVLLSAEPRRRGLSHQGRHASTSHALQTLKHWAYGVLVCGVSQFPGGRAVLSTNIAFALPSWISRVRQDRGHLCHVTGHRCSQVPVCRRMGGRRDAGSPWMET